jgi:hypothetical protein
MNSDFFCPIWGYPHSIDGDKQTHFLTRTTLIRHLHTPSHSSTHHLVNHTRCANACIYTCCTSSCPSSPKIFFSSLRALHDHCEPKTKVQASTQTPSTSLKNLSNNPSPPSNQTYITSSILSTKTNSHTPSNVTSLMSIYFAYTRIPRTPPNFAPLESPPPFVASSQAALPIPFETNSHHTYSPTTMRLAFLMAATLS